MDVNVVKREFENVEYPNTLDHIFYESNITFEQFEPIFTIGDITVKQAKQKENKLYKVYRYYVNEKDFVEVVFYPNTIDVYSVLNTKFDSTQKLKEVLRDLGFVHTIIEIRLEERYKLRKIFD